MNEKNITIILDDKEYEFLCSLLSGLFAGSLKIPEKKRGINFPILSNLVRTKFKSK